MDVALWEEWGPYALERFPDTVLGADGGDQIQWRTRVAELPPPPPSRIIVFPPVVGEDCYATWLEEFFFLNDKDHWKPLRPTPESTTWIAAVRSPPVEYGPAAPRGRWRFLPPYGSTRISDWGALAFERNQPRASFGDTPACFRKWVSALQQRLVDETPPDRPWKFPPVDRYVHFRAWDMAFKELSLQQQQQGPAFTPHVHRLLRSRPPPPPPQVQALLRCGCKVFSHVRYPAEELFPQGTYPEDAEMHWEDGLHDWKCFASDVLRVLSEFGMHGFHWAGLLDASTFSFSDWRRAFVTLNTPPASVQSATDSVCPGPIAFLPCTPVLRNVSPYFVFHSYVVQDGDDWKTFAAEVLRRYDIRNNDPTEAQPHFSMWLDDFLNGLLQHKTT